jgi:hypothetical protein
MAILPKNENSISFVSTQRDLSEEIKKPRSYLGMSGIGHPCMRHLWLGFHWVVENKVNKRVKRIFERGDWEEHRLIRDLKSMGVECFRRDIAGKKIEIFGHKDEEQEEIIGFARHAKGHIDGRCINVPDAPKTEHLAEFKTANDKNFKLFYKKGSEEANIVYYSQTQRYMHGLKLTRALFCVTNKNDEHRYFERIPYRKSFADDLVKKEQHIIMSDSPPEKIGGPNWYECKWCNHKEFCHSGMQPQQNCRTCDMSDIENRGKWSCTYKEKDLTIDEQRIGCNVWKRGWSL